MQKTASVAFIAMGLIAVGSVSVFNLDLNDLEIQKTSQTNESVNKNEFDIVTFKDYSQKLIENENFKNAHKSRKIKS